MNSLEEAKRVGKRLKKLREKARLTQAEVAKRAGIKSTNYYAVIERGEVVTKWPKLQKIAGALEVDISEILK